MPVLLVHGTAGCRRQWRNQVAHLAPHRKLGAYDLRGMGSSPLPRTPDYRVETMAADALAVATALKFSRFVAVGHGFGAAVVAALARLAPERVAGVLYVDPDRMLGASPEGIAAFLANFDEGRWSLFRGQWFESLLVSARPEVREEVLASLKETPRTVARAVAEGQLTFDATTCMRSIKAPQLVVTSADLSPKSQVGRIPGLSSEPLSGVSHWPMLDAPERFNAVLDAFLTRVEAPAPAPALEQAFRPAVPAGVDLSRPRASAAIEAPRAAAAQAPRAAPVQAPRAAAVEATRVAPVEAPRAAAVEAPSGPAPAAEEVRSVTVPAAVEGPRAPADAAFEAPSAPAPAISAAAQASDAPKAEPVTPVPETPAPRTSKRSPRPKKPARKS